MNEYEYKFNVLMTAVSGLIDGGTREEEEGNENKEERYIWGGGGKLVL